MASHKARCEPTHSSLCWLTRWQKLRPRNFRTTVCDMEGDARVNTLAHRLGEVEADTLGNTLGDVEVAKLVDTLADMPAEVKAKTLGVDTLTQVKAETLSYSGRD